MRLLRLVVRRLPLALVGFSVLVAVTGSTWAGNIKIVSYDQSLNGTTNYFTFPPADHCTGEPRTIVLKSEGRFRITMVESGPDRGFYWISPIQRGTFEILSVQPNEPTYRGNFELLPDSHTAHDEQMTFFLHLVGTGSDGSPLDARLLERLSVSQDKVTISAGSPTFLSTQLDCA